MAKAAASAEPSMEEILASIRRIISDESDARSPAEVKGAAVPSKPPAPALAAEHVSEEDLDKLFAQSEPAEAEPAAVVPAAPVPADTSVEDVLDLAALADVDSDTPLVLEEADVEFVEPEPESEPVLSIAPEPEPDPEPEPAPPPAAEERRSRPRAARQPSAEDEDSPLLSETTGASVHAAFGQLSHTILTANAKTLDDLVKEMLRPMLRAWLDENLPAIVERLVRAEIERVSRGR